MVLRRVPHPVEPREGHGTVAFSPCAGATKSPEGAVPRGLAGDPHVAGPHAAGTPR